MLRFLIIAALVLFLVLGASIGYFNAQEVEFDYLAGSVRLPNSRPSWRRRSKIKSSE